MAGVKWFDFVSSAVFAALAITWLSEDKTTTQGFLATALCAQTISNIFSDKLIRLLKTSVAAYKKDASRYLALLVEVINNTKGVDNAVIVNGILDKHLARWKVEDKNVIKTS